MLYFFFSLSIKYAIDVKCITIFFSLAVSVIKTSERSRLFSHRYPKVFCCALTLPVFPSSSTPVYHFYHHFSFASSAPTSRPSSVLLFTLYSAFLVSSFSFCIISRPPSFPLHFIFVPAHFLFLFLLVLFLRIFTHFIISSVSSYLSASSHILFLTSSFFSSLLYSYSPFIFSFSSASSYLFILSHTLLSFPFPPLPLPRAPALTLSSYFIKTRDQTFDVKLEWRITLSSITTNTIIIITDNSKRQK